MQKFVYDIGPWSLQLLLLVVAVMVWSFLLLRIAPYRLIDMKQTHFPPFQKQHSRPKRNRQKWYYISTIIFLGDFDFAAATLIFINFIYFLHFLLLLKAKFSFLQKGWKSRAAKILNSRCWCCCCLRCCCHRCFCCCRRRCCCRRCCWLSVWPNVKMTCCPKRSHNSFYLVVTYFEVAKEATKYLGYFCYTLCHLDIPKITQSGRTVAFVQCQMKCIEKIVFAWKNLCANCMLSSGRIPRNVLLHRFHHYVWLCYHSMV